MYIVINQNEELVGLFYSEQEVLTHVDLFVKEGAYAWFPWVVYQAKKIATTSVYTPQPVVSLTYST